MPMQTTQCKQDSMVFSFDGTSVSLASPGAAAVQQALLLLLPAARPHHCRCCLPWLLLPPPLLLGWVAPCVLL
jgi:hypothetical protein